MQQYFVISTGPDGIYTKAMNKEEMLEWWADHVAEDGVTPEDAFPGELNPAYWGDALVIIKGEVVEPTPVETVTAWEIE